MIEDQGMIDLHMGKYKWAELAAWEMLNDATKKEIILRKLDRRINRKEYKIGVLKDKIETLQMMKRAIEAK